MKKRSLLKWPVICGVLFVTNLFVRESLAAGFDGMALFACGMLFQMELSRWVFKSEQGSV